MWSAAISIVRDALGAMLRNPVALIVLVALIGVIYLAANDKEIPAVLAAVLGFLAGSLIVRRG